MKIKGSIAVIAVFLLPVAAALYNTFSYGNFERSSTFETHYVQSGQLLSKWVSDLIQGDCVNPRLSPMGEAVLVEGLFMPSIAATLTNFAQVLNVTPPVLFAIFQALLAGLNALLVSRLCRRLGFSRLFAQCAGLAWGLYPAQIIASARFGSELLATALSLSLVLLSASLLPRGGADKKRNLTVRDLITALGAGIAFILFMHLQPLLTPVACVLLILTLLNVQPRRRSLTLMACFATGAFITLTPWLIFSQAALNHCTLLPDRAAALSLASGLDSEADGSATVPPTPAQSLARDQPPLDSFVVAVNQRPFTLPAMCARKVKRIFSHPWNDFKSSSLGLPPSAQILIHQLLLLGGILGAVYLIFMERLWQNKINNLSGRDLIKIAALLMVAGHFTLIFFEAQPRYGFTAMPWIVILTIIGLDHVEHTGYSRAVSASFILAVILVVVNRIELAPLLVKGCGNIYNATKLVNFVLALALAAWLATCSRAAEAKRLGGVNSEKNLNVFGSLILAGSLIFSFAFLHLQEQFASPPQWLCQLKGEQSVERAVTIPEAVAARWKSAKKGKDLWAAVLIDGSESVEKCTVSLNGVRLPQAQTLIDFVDKFKASDEAKMVSDTARAAGIPVRKMKQWRVAPAPLTAIDFSPQGKNTITITAPKDGAILYGQYALRGEAPPLPALWTFSLSKYSFDGDMRVVLTPQRREALMSKTDLAPTAGEQNGEYRLYLLLGDRQERSDTWKQSDTRKPSKTISSLKRFNDSHKIVL